MLISGSSRRDDPSGTSARKGFLQRLFSIENNIAFLAGVESRGKRNQADRVLNPPATGLYDAGRPRSARPSLFYRTLAGGTRQRRKTLAVPAGGSFRNHGKKVKVNSRKALFLSLHGEVYQQSAGSDRRLSIFLDIRPGRVTAKRALYLSLPPAT